MLPEIVEVELEALMRFLEFQDECGCHIGYNPNLAFLLGKILAIPEKKEVTTLTVLYILLAVSSLYLSKARERTPSMLFLGATSDLEGDAVCCVEILDC